MLPWVLTSIGVAVVIGVAGNAVGRAIADAALVEPARLAHPVGVAVGAASVGVLQWRVLRHRVFRAGLWALVSTVGFAGGWVLGHAVGHFAHLPAAWVAGALVSGTMAAGAAVGGAVAGVITILILVWVSGQPVPGSVAREIDRHDPRRRRDSAGVEEGDA